MRVRLYMTAYYLAHAVYQSYMSLFYQEQGLSSAQIGAVYALIAAVSIPGQTLFGAVSDRAARPGRVLRRLLALSAALLFLQTRVRGLTALMTLAGLFGFFYTPLQPLGDALALSTLRREGAPFGPVRLTGALAFAFSSLAFGLLFDLSGRGAAVIVGAAALLLAALAASCLLRDAPRAREAARSPRPLWNGRLLRLLAFTLPAQTTMGYFYAFFPTRFMALPGASGALLGWANLLAAAAEIPFLLFSDRLFHRWGAARMVALATLALGARWLLVGLSTSAVWLLVSQVLHGLGYIVISVGMALHIAESAPPEARASGQALLSVFCYGLARVLGSALGGLTAQKVGRAGGFLGCAALCFLSLPAFFPLWRESLCNSRRDML